MQRHDWRVHASTMTCEASAEFQLLVEETEADMAAQREQVREMENTGAAVFDLIRKQVAALEKSRVRGPRARRSK